MIARQGWPRGQILAVLVCAAFYLPFVGRGFTSEDFLLLRLLDESPPWTDLSRLLTRPWLGVESVGFYRPVAWLLFGIEEAILGTWSPGYNLVHLAIHLWSVTRVFEIVRLCLGVGGEVDAARWWHIEAPALGAALCFGLYPLHPNAVSWAASYANLFGSAFVLTGLWLFVSAHERRSLGRYFGSFVCTLLALGSYESSVLVPVLVVLLEVLVLRSRPRRIAATAAFGAAVLAAYFLVRRVVVGATVGGYAGAMDVFFGSSSALLNQVGRALSLFVWPRYESPISSASGWFCLAALGLIVLVASVVFLRTPEWRLEASLVLFSGMFVVGAMAPFSFGLVWPGEGRYFYLSAAGFAIGFGALVRSASRLPGRWSRLLVVLLLVLPLAYVPALRAHLGWMQEAARESARLAQALRETQRELGIGRRIFVGDVPRFVKNAQGVHLAQIHHYGLRDREMPPFTDQPIDVFPLLGPSRPAASALAPFGVVVDWREGGLEPVSPHRESLPGGFEVVEWGREPLHRGIHFRVPQELRGSKFEMVVVSGGNTLRRVFEPDFETGSDSDLMATGPYPENFLAMMSTLYPGGEFFVWIEARDQEYRLLGVSSALGFQVP